MNRIYLVVILLISSVCYGQVQHGFFAGPQVTNVQYKVKGSKQETDFKTGFQAGWQMKVPFENRLNFAPSVSYNMRGYDVKFDTRTLLPDSAALDNNTRFHSVELSFLLQHDFTLEPGHFFFRIGPSLDFVLTGKESFNTDNGQVNRKMKFSFSDYGRYLANAVFQLGFESASGFYFYGHYNYSMTTMNNADRGPSIGNRAAGITIGTFLKRDKIVLDTRNKQ